MNFRNKLFWIFIVILVIPYVAAEERITLSTYKQEFSPQETVQLLVRVSDKPVYALESSTLHLFDMAGQEIKIAPLRHTIQSGVYFYSFSLPIGLANGEYTLQIGPVKYVVNKTLQEFSFYHKIAVRESNYALQIQPAFLMADENLEIKLTSKKGNFNIQVQSPSEITHTYQEKLSILEERSRFLVFSAAKKIGSDVIINLSAENKSYFLPVFTSIVKSQNAPESPVQAGLFSITPTEIVQQLSRKEAREGFFEVINFWDQPLRVDFIVDDSLHAVLSVNESSILVPPKEKYRQYIWINRNEEERAGTYEGKIVAKGGEQTEEIPVTITFGAQPQQEQLPPPVQEPEVDTSAPEPEQVSPAQDAGLDFFKNATYSPPERKRSVIPFVLTGIFLLILAAVFLLGKRKKREQTFDEYLENIKKRRES